MRKALFTLTVLFAMMAASLSAKAQEITITLLPGCTWISYTNAEAMSITTALGDFVPMEGDVIKSQYASTTYSHGRWMGRLQQFTPGLGYMYISKRGEPVSLVFAASSSSFVATAAPSDITAVSAVVGGTVTLPEDSHVFLRGVCWGTASNPNIDGDHTSDGTGIGSFTGTLEGLNPNTTYYVRAYAVSDYGLAYGNELTFTTLSGIPVVSTTEVTDITATTATCGGTVTDGGGLDITARGVCWSTSHNPTLNNNHTSDGTGTGSFGSSLITLSPGTTYYVRAYATTTQATSYGEEVSFTTMNGIPSVSTAEVTNITTTTATCGGTVTTDGGLTVTARGVCWSTSHNPTLSDSHTTDGTGTGSFSSSLTGLMDNTTYYVRAYASNSYVTIYGNEVSFTTEQIPSYTVSVSCSPSDGGTVEGGGTYQEGQTCTVTATANAGYTFSNWTEDGEVVYTNAAYTFTVNGNRNLVANFAVSGGDDHGYVDLGLPSGLLWATCNVGADTPEDYGDYFAWGETAPKSVYNWDTYQYNDGSNLTKYTGSDGLTTLLPEDDAATANWGSDWRMPTYDNWVELYLNTTVTWTTQNGVNGRLFTASNGNSLFLPAAGYRNDSSLDYAGSDGYYWSSSLNSVTPDGAWALYFGSDDYGMSSIYRYYGHSVRPVRSSQN